MGNQTIISFGNTGAEVTLVHLEPVDEKDIVPKKFPTLPLMFTLCNGFYQTGGRKWDDRGCCLGRDSHTSILDSALETLVLYCAPSEDTQDSSTRFLGPTKVLCKDTGVSSGQPGNGHREGSGVEVHGHQYSLNERKYP